MSKIRLGVFYGGETVEHEVSVITAVQLMKHADKSKYEIVPIYIDKAGQWWTGNQLTDIQNYGKQDLFKPSGFTPFALSQNKVLQSGEDESVMLTDGGTHSRAIDVAILCFHGGYGESGNVQGLLELAGIPYQGPAVTSSAVCFDKIFTRQVFQAEGINQAKYTWFTHIMWQNNKPEILKNIKQLGYPVFVKPANGGSTIGIEKVKEENAIEKTIENVLQYDQRIIVEKEVSDCIEVNVSVLGIDGDLKASVPEQPIKADEFLSYADKYERGGGKKSGMASASRRIPAPISSSLTEKLQELAKTIFVLFDCSGVVRIDFFVDPSEETIFVTELNTIPGSMSFYLWEASGMPYAKMIDQLVHIAQEKATRRKGIIKSFDSNILKNKTSI